MDETTASVILAAIAALVSIATAAIAAWGAVRANAAASLSQSTDIKTDQLSLTVNGRLSQLLSEAQGRARAEGVIAGVSSSGDRRSGSLQAAVSHPPVPPASPAPLDPIDVRTAPEVYAAAESHPAAVDDRAIDELRRHS